MADNVSYTPGSGVKIASREVTYSGEAAQAQAVGLLTFAGSDDAKTAADVSATNPLPTTDTDAEFLLRNIYNLLTSPPGWDSSLRRMRVDTGTIATITTVTTVTSLNQLDGRPAGMLVNFANLSAWANCVRARIT